MKIGVNLKIDVTNIDKSKMFKGQNGTYLDATVFIDTESHDNYGNHGMITQNWKDAPKGQTPILGNAKVFWTEQQGNGQGSYQAPKQHTSTSQQTGQGQESSFDCSDDIPFMRVNDKLSLVI